MKLQTEGSYCSGTRGVFQQDEERSRGRKHARVGTLLSHRLLPAGRRWLIHAILRATAMLQPAKRAAACFTMSKPRRKRPNLLGFVWAIGHDCMFTFCADSAVGLEHFCHAKKNCDDLNWNEELHSACMCVHIMLLYSSTLHKF